ncbi:MAG: histidine phosphatase family protein [Bryobacterales bacterium]|nr:histidine phosphatase family protein [Bryobacterales bacterium]
MGVLLVVRHGQASFLADNYDKLSERGERQSRLLGEYWVAQGVEITQVVTGPAERQIRTAVLAGEAYRRAGLSWPEPVVDHDLDEYPAEKVVRTFLPPLTERYAHLADFVAQFQSTADFSLKQKLFDKVLREVSQRWLEGEVVDESFINWPSFCRRIEGSVRRILDSAPKSSTIAVFTSAGPTAAVARVALGLTDAATLNLTWSVRNASVSEFLFTKDRFSMSTFNTTPHLADAALLTYR